MDFKLHPQLEADCFTLGLINNCTLLLHKNALIPWFILVPHTHKNEIFKLQTIQQQQLQITINQLAQFVESNFNTDKLNIATIGNVVSQLHVHIIGRYKNDFCWPEPVWGKTQFNEYSAEELQSIKNNLHNSSIMTK